MVLAFLERSHCLLHRNLLESHPVTGFNLTEKRKVCGDDGSHFPVAASDGLYKQNDGLTVSRNLNRAGHNPFRDNGIAQFLLTVKRRPGESNPGSIGL